MDILSALVGLLVGALLAAAITWALTRSRGQVALARAEAERDALAERVEDLAARQIEEQATERFLAPMADALQRVEGQVRAMEAERARQLGEVAGQLATVHRGTTALGEQTAVLVESLRSSQTRGAWGEVQLRRVLEISGMLPRCDFDEQVTGTNAGGSTVRPDVAVNLPGGKHLVVDAKAPMAAFLAAQAEDLSPIAADGRLAAHAKALRAHVDTLAAKQYWTALPGTPEMVVCFVPSEAMLTAALARDPGLHEYALERRVVLVGPGSLLALLRSVAFTWQQDVLVENAEELMALGKELYARIGTLAGHTVKLGSSLSSSVQAYNALLGSLESRVLVTARKLEDLGVAAATTGKSPVPLEVAPRTPSAPELTEAQDGARPLGTWRRPPA